MKQMRRYLKLGAAGEVKHSSKRVFQNRQMPLRGRAG